MSCSRLFFVLCLVIVPFKATAEQAPPVFIGATNLVLTGNVGAQNRFEAVVMKAVEAHQKLDTKRYWNAFQQELGNPRQYTLARTFNTISGPILGEGAEHRA